MSLNWTFPYPSQRMPVFARNVVATSQPLAAQAGLQMLARGGNAVDAALAAAITLTVVEPTSNGIGSDAFAIIWDGKELHGLNGSGRSPRAWSPSRFSGWTRMPELGWDAVTVPGAVDVWVSLSRRFGKLPFADLFEPAIRYATDGFIVSPMTAAKWFPAPKLYAGFPDFAPAFLPGGRAPLAGELFHPQGMAGTLRLIAETGGESFYRGQLAEKIASRAAQTGGAMTREDLAEHRSEWVKTLSRNWQGTTLHELPPNGQGLTVLIALGILEHLAFAQHPVDSADNLHLQIEAMKMAFAISQPHIADPAWMKVQPASLLDESFLEERARTLRIDRAQYPAHAIPSDGGTVYLTAADQGGMMVSYIQSNYHRFRIGDRHSRHRNQPPEPRPRFHTGRRASQLRRRGEAPLSHDHSGIRDERRSPSDELRRDGCPYAGPGPRTDDGPYHRRQSESASCRGRPPLVSHRKFPFGAGERVQPFRQRGA